MLLSIGFSSKDEKAVEAKAAQLEKVMVPFGGECQSVGEGDHFLLREYEIPNEHGAVATAALEKAGFEVEELTEIVADPWAKLKTH